MGCMSLELKSGASMAYCLLLKKATVSAVATSRLFGTLPFVPTWTDGIFNGEDHARRVILEQSVQNQCCSCKRFQDDHGCKKDSCR